MEETKRPEEDEAMEQSDAVVPSEPKLTGFTRVLEVAPAETTHLVMEDVEPTWLSHRFDSAPDVLSILSFTFREFRNEVDNGFTFDFSHLFKTDHDLKNHTAYFAEDVQENAFTFHSACLSHELNDVPPSADVFVKYEVSVTKFTSASSEQDTRLVICSDSYKRLFLNKFSSWLKVIQTRLYSNLVHGGYIRVKFTPKPWPSKEKRLGFSLKVELVREDDAPRFVTSIERVETKRVRFESE
jgi:hypothetical protein